MQLNKSNYRKAIMELFENINAVSSEINKWAKERRANKLLENKIYIEIVIFTQNENIVILVMIPSFTKIIYQSIYIQPIKPIVEK